MSGGAAPKQQLKLKLRQSPGSEANTPGARSSATPGVIVDNDALGRQQRHVLDSVNGSRSSRPSSAGKSATPSATANMFGRQDTSAAVPRATGSPALPNGIKQDTSTPNPGGLGAFRLRSNPQIPTLGQSNSITGQAQPQAMAPPQGLARPPSGSPHPNGITQPGYTGSYQQPQYFPPPPPRVDSFRKIPLNSKRTHFQFREA